MFSSRTRWDRTENRLTALLAAKRRSGATILDLTESNPTRAGLLCPTDVVLLLAGPGSLRYDPEPRGLVGAREAVAADYVRRGVEVAPERIVLTASTSEAYSFALQLLCDPGDSILVPRPSYPLFDFLAGLASVGLERYPLAHEGSWRLDLPALGSQVTRSTRAVVCSTSRRATATRIRRSRRATPSWRWISTRARSSGCSSPA